MTCLPFSEVRNEPEAEARAESKAEKRVEQKAGQRKTCVSATGGSLATVSEGLEYQRKTRLTVNAPDMFFTGHVQPLEADFVLAWVISPGHRTPNLGADPRNTGEMLLNLIDEGAFDQMRLTRHEVQIEAPLGFVPLFSRNDTLRGQLTSFIERLASPLPLDLPTLNTCPLVSVMPGVALAAFKYQRPSTFGGLFSGFRYAVDLISGGLILSCLGLEARLSPIGRGEMGSRTAEVYKQIFASYSHKDAEVVKSFSTVLDATGVGELIYDTKVLRSGDLWERKVLKEIETADSFQLFWSKNSKASKHVTDEWKHALKLSRERFIKPVYWRQPMPPPPKKLRHLHFAFISLAGEKY